MRFKVLNLTLGVARMSIAWCGSHKNESTATLYDDGFCYEGLPLTEPRAALSDCLELPNSCRLMGSMPLFFWIHQCRRSRRQIWRLWTEVSRVWSHRWQRNGHCRGEWHRQSLGPSGALDQRLRDQIWSHTGCLRLRVCVDVARGPSICQRWISESCDQGAMESFYLLKVLLIAFQRGRVNFYRCLWWVNNKNQPVRCLSLSPSARWKAEVHGSNPRQQRG